MIKRALVSLIIFTASICLLTLYNYSQAQKNLRQARPTVLTIKLISDQTQADRVTPTKFNWQVDGPESFSAVTTGIYWGYDSTPSAATKFDSPKALAYPNYTQDYAIGRFRLPDTFDVNVTFSLPGTVYYRAYALVGEDHLWSEQRQITVK